MLSEESTGRALRSFRRLRSDERKDFGARAPSGNRNGNHWRRPRPGVTRSATFPERAPFAFVNQLILSRLEAETAPRAQRRTEATLSSSKIDRRLHRGRDHGRLVAADAEALLRLEAAFAVATLGLQQRMQA